jgi:lipoyl(octanoyl) transferase
MLKRVNFQDLGSSDYKKTWEYQEKLFDKILEQKLQKPAVIGEGEPFAGYLLFCEHPHVFTLGKSGTENNLLADAVLLKKLQASYYRIDRGGDITYHGPGQIVGYPILDLERFGLGIRQYIYNLEEAIIMTLMAFGIHSSRLDSASGVWLDASTPSISRKICAVGVRASRHVTMHGFAFNVNTDLNYFGYINPCGFKDKGVTSMEKELGNRQDADKIKETLKASLSSVFGMELIINQGSNSQ